MSGAYTSNKNGGTGDATVAVATPFQVKSSLVGVRYFVTNSWSVAAAANQNKYESTALTTKNHAYLLSTTYKLGQHNVLGMYQHLGKFDNVANTGAKKFLAEYSYDFSKRTAVYARYVKVENESAAGYGMYGSLTPNDAITPTGAAGNAIAMGLRTTF